MSQTEIDERLTWFEARVTDELGEPVPSVAYRLELPTGSIIRGTSSKEGLIHHGGIPPGICRLTLTKLDEAAWSVS